MSGIPVFLLQVFETFDYKAYHMRDTSVTPSLTRNRINNIKSRFVVTKIMIKSPNHFVCLCLTIYLECIPLYISRILFRVSKTQFIFVATC